MLVEGQEKVVGCEMIWSRLAVDGEKQGKSIFVKEGVH